MNETEKITAKENEAEESAEIANMDLTDYMTLLEELDHR